ncbi:hypothetical protein SAMN05421768_11227 [Chryseobacterium joostei]|uniref:Uncharacterized protein n=2 Tax=Chryseobacterium joostei TaxID=112234 RepID=A0A1N7KH09_9FLAO|nr:hypothetical protein [Chryseobacterium joostei]SIS60819.1 hypothetical protein SAMN05421768_11227 [Chryseobacterium joostei]
MGKIITPIIALILIISMFLGYNFYGKNFLIFISIIVMIASLAFQGKSFAERTITKKKFIFNMCIVAGFMILLNAILLWYGR